MLRIDVFGRSWDLHTMIAGCLMLIIGVQVVSLGLCAHAYGKYFMGERDPWFDRMRARFRLEHGLLLGGVVIAGRRRRRGGDHRSASGSTATSAPCPRSAWRSLAATLIIVGLQVFFSSFLLSILGLRRRS